VITPRHTRLIRTPHLRAFQRAIASVSIDGSFVERRARAVIVPTDAAAGELARTLDHHAPDSRRAPALVARDQGYRLLHARVPGLPPLLTELEREVLMGRAAREASDSGAPAPFALRPGLLIEILGLYDELGRRHRTIDAFERLLVGSLAPSADLDRGAARMLAQTRFLVSAFRAYEALVDGSGKLDERSLRANLISEASPDPLRHVVVTVSDQNTDARGLWPADFDLLTRLPGLERIDVVATEEILGSGFLERVHDLLPDLVEERISDAEEARPRLVVPPAPAGRRYWLARDREEELVDAVRRLHGGGAEPSGAGSRTDPDRVAIVFQRPLPYLYLARHVFGAASRPYQAFDALPLAAEPYAAAVDLVLSAVTSAFIRSDTVALLRSPQLILTDDGVPLHASETAALDRLLREESYLGGVARLEEIATRLERRVLPTRGDDAWSAARAARTAARVARELTPLLEPAPGSEHLSTLARFLDRHDRPRAGIAWDERRATAREAIRSALESLAGAHRDHDDREVPFAAVAATLRRWIEGQTLTPRTGSAGPHLVDAAAARYGDFDEVHIVGLVDADWPEPPTRNIFYPASLLVQLGWPALPDRANAARGTFRDLLRLPASRLVLSVFTLEDDAVTAPSMLLELVDDATLPVDLADRTPTADLFAHDVLMDSPGVPDEVRGVSPEWLAFRTSRRLRDERFYRGGTGPRPAVPYRVSHLERYLACPFRYFAAHVLELGEERGEEPGLSALDRGRLVHEVFEAFFAAWHAEGRRAITPENVADAVAAFSRIAEDRLASLPEPDRSLERTRLLGSAAASGLATRAFEFEIEAGVEVVERLVEHPLRGRFSFASGDRERSVSIRGKADRIDLLADGTLRLVDYKLGRAPKTQRAIQLPVYGVAAEQDLRGRLGRDWEFRAAGYLAFGERQTFVPLATLQRPFAEAVADGIGRFLTATEGVERGEFPVRPDQPFLCTFCPYPSVCRKDYVGDE
jgi:RecB family exonuclease